MATTTTYPQFYEHLDVDSESESDSESLFTDDGQDHPPEKILAEYKNEKQDILWYLIKWKDCALLRSSWEGCSLIEEFVQTTHPNLLVDWEVEKERQLNGISKPLDKEVFSNAVLKLENAQRQRRVLRRLKGKVNRVLSILTAD